MSAHAALPMAAGRWRLTLMRVMWVAVLAQAVTGIAAAATVTITCGSTGRELDLCREGANAWAAKTGHAVKLVTMPGADALALTQQLLAAGAADIDVFQVDIASSGVLARHLFELGPQAGARVGQHFPAMIRSATVGGRLVGMPWFGDAGILYYRKDLLEKYGVTPPKTWAELRRLSALIQAGERQRGADKFWGFVWQGRAYEGLTCNALEWVYSHNGGTVIDDAGKVTINNPGAITALREAAGWVGSITPKGVLNYTEEEARGVFQSGDAAFMRNWPYAWALLNDSASTVRGRVGVAPLPAGEGGKSAGTLAGSLLVVNKYSQHPQLAADLVLYLTSAEEQKRRAIKGAYNPTLPSLYSDPEILAASPYLGSLYETFANAVARPSTATGAKYNRVSIEFSNAVHSVLAGETEAAYRLQSLDSKLRRLKRGGKW